MVEYFEQFDMESKAEEKKYNEKTWKTIKKNIDKSFKSEKRRSFTAYPKKGENTNGKAKSTPYYCSHHSWNLTHTISNCFTLNKDKRDKKPKSKYCLVNAIRKRADKKAKKKHKKKNISGKK